MIDLNFRLPYRNSPYDKVRSHNVYQLSDEGFNKYISKDHITHKYLNKFRILKIVADDETTTTDKNKQNKNLNNNLSDLKCSSASSPSQNANCMQPQNENVNMFRNYSSFKKSSKNKTRSKLTSPKNMKNMTRNSNMNYLPTETSSFNVTDYLNTTTSKLREKRTGFGSQQVPRVEHLLNEQKRIMSSTSHNFRHKIYKTLAWNKNKEDPQISNGDKDQIHIQDDDIMQVCNTENEKMKNLILTQTSTNFLKGSRLPRIKNVKKEEPVILSSNNRLGNCKLMGEKYNPFNFDIGKTKNMTKRNVFGALYGH
jgi:hypothetical protein